MLSHKLRNPLAAVLNATSLLEEVRLESEPFREAKDVIDRNVRHVARILDDLLDVSRITSDKINLHKNVIDLTSLVMDVVECVQHRMDAKQQDLHVSKPLSPLYVEGDITGFNRLRGSTRGPQISRA